MLWAILSCSILIWFSASVLEFRCDCPEGNALVLDQDLSYLYQPFPGAAVYGQDNTPILDLPCEHSNGERTISFPFTLDGMADAEEWLESDYIKEPWDYDNY